MTRSETLRDMRQRVQVARKAFDEARGNLPSSGPQNGSGGVCTNGGPTARLATEHLSGHADIADVDEERLNQLLERLYRVIARVVAGDILAITRDIDKILDVWAPREETSERREANLRAAADDLLDRRDWNKCKSCRRVKDRAPNDARKAGSDHCQFCYRWTRTLNDPTGDWAGWHFQLDHPPVEFVASYLATGAGDPRHLPKPKPLTTPTV
jgi:hypothetical protein